MQCFLNTPGEADPPEAKGDDVMLAVERKNRILEILNREKIVKVEALSEEFGVSVMTIRRDLEKCEKEGLVHRCHGGAVLKNDITREVVYADKLTSHTDGKERIAAYAAKLIKPGNTIFLDAGTTVLRLAQKLVDIPDLTVVTNDLAIATLLCGTRTSIIMLGGLVSNQLGSTHGHMTERMLSELRIETAFVGGQAVNKDFDLFAATESKVTFRKLLMQQSNKVYLLVDGEKFYKQSLFKIHSLAEYTGVVTDKPIIDTEQSYFDERNIDMISIGE